MLGRGFPVFRGRTAGVRGGRYGLGRLGVWRFVLGRRGVIRIGVGGPVFLLRCGVVQLFFSLPTPHFYD